jgi:hypothetical protein
VNPNLGVDPVGVVGPLDKIRKEWLRLSPEAQWSNLFGSVVPKEFNVTFKKNTDPESLYLVPERWEEMEVWARARAGREGALVFTTSPRNTWAAIMMATGVERFRSSIYVRMMRHYMDIGLKMGKKEPIIPGGPGMELRDGIDSLCGPRIHLLMMGFWNEIQMKIDLDVLEEVVVGMFRDPYNEAAFVKSNTSILKQLVFARASSGQVIKWSPMQKKTDHLAEFIVGRIENDGCMFRGEHVPFNDTAYYTTVAEKVKEGLAELRQGGYSKLAMAFEKLLAPGLEVTEEGLASMSILNSIESLVGFTRGEKIQSFKKQIHKDGTTPANPGYLPELETVINDMVDWAAVEGRFPTNEEWFARIHTALNSNSAGGPKAEYEFAQGNASIKFSASDKTLVFLSDPERWISEAEFDIALTKLFPGGITSRDVVGGRDTRAVWMIALVIYLYETAWGYAELEYLTRAVDYASFGEVGLDAHKYYIYATSVWNIVNVLKDFSSYDTTQEWPNARGPFMRLMVEALERNKINGQIGNLGSFQEVYIKVAHKLKDAVFDLGNGELVNPQQTHSGELNTANRNTLIHKAEDDYEERIINERYPKLRDKIGKRMHLSLLGDDNQKAFITSGPVTSDDHVDWGEAIENAATECGFVINRFKTVRRISYGEFLKVLYIYGAMIPQLGRLMPFSSERTNSLLDPVEAMRGLYSFFRTVVARGGPHEWCVLFLHHTWNLRRGVRKTFFRNKEDKVKQTAELGKTPERFVDFPFALIWTPQSLGGIGELPFTIVGASKDSMIYLWTRRFPGLREMINDAAFALDYGGADVNRDIAIALESSGATKKYEEWLNKHVIKTGRHKRMKEERDRFPFIKLGDLDYEFSARRRIIRTLAGASKVNALAIRKKQLQSQRVEQQLLKVNSKDYLGDMFGWMDVIEVAEGELLAEKQDVAAVIGRDPTIARIEKTLGFSTVVNDQRSRMQDTFRILNDNIFNADAELGFDTLLALFTRPDIFPNIDRIASVAVRIGADPGHAMRFAQRFVGVFDSALIQEKGQKFSSGDEMGQTWDMSYHRIGEVVDVPPWILQTDVSYLIRQVGIMMLITTPMHQPLRKKIIKTLGDAENAVLNALSPKFNSPLRSYMNSFPLNTWY